jgi:hypothetical protein
MTYNPADHTIDEVNEHLEQHPEDREAVLAAEKARGDEARSTLVSSLEGGSTDQQKAGDDPEQQPAGEDVPKPEDATIYPPGEYPSEEEAGIPGSFGYHSDAPGVQAGREASQPGT